MKDLAAQVEAVNAANKVAGVLYEKLVPIFTPFVGQKIEKVDGTLLAKIVKLLPDFNRSPSLTVYKLRSDYSLAWVAKTCVNSGGCAHYYETTSYIGEMRDGVLVKIGDPCIRRTDYTAEEVTEKRQIYKAAQEAADKAKGDLYPFMEY